MAYMKRLSNHREMFSPRNELIMWHPPTMDPQGFGTAERTTECGHFSMVKNMIQRSMDARRNGFGPFHLRHPRLIFPTRPQINGTCETLLATSRDGPLQHFLLSEQKKVFGRKCEEKDENEDNGFTCQSETWACKNDQQFGTSCQFPHAPCEVLEIDEQYKPFADARSWSTQYEIVKKNDGSIIQVYGRPVYIGLGSEDVMLFTGQRWLGLDA